ncbi:MAG: DUF2285 domain-containing protein [Rhodospirillales bacterium]|nr:DUF2285 domain-containing protein [Rhodospirillales bacterium]
MLFWTADATARIVRARVLDNDSGTTPLVRFEPERWGAPFLGRPTPDGYHVIVAPNPGTRHHLLLPGPDPPARGAILTPVIPWDAWHKERLEAARAFWQFAARPRVSPAPRSSPPRPHPRGLKIAYMAWALDLAAAGMSERDIHRMLLGEPPAAWEDSGARSRIRTLLATARRWRDGAAFQLLRPPRPLRAG